MVKLPRDRWRGGERPIFEVASTVGRGGHCGCQHSERERGSADFALPERGLRVPTSSAVQRVLRSRCSNADALGLGDLHRSCPPNDPRAAGGPLVYISPHTSPARSLKQDQAHDAKGSTDR